MQIDFRLLRQAQALAEHGSFSRAAEALNIAQPSLSRGIKELEARVGLPLFERRRSGHQPTDFGRLFLDHTAQLLAGVGDLEQEVARAKGLVTGELAVGFGAYAVEALAPVCAPGFVAKHPSLRLRVRMEEPAAMARSLRARTIDLAVGEASVLADDDAIEVIATLAPLIGYVVVRAGHPLTRQPHPTLNDVLAYPFAQVVMLPARVLKPLLAARGAASMPGFPAIECPSFNLAARIVATTDAFTFASLSTLRDGMNRGELVPLLQAPWLHAEWSIARLRRRILSPAMTDLVEALQRAHVQLLSEEAELRERWMASS
jgi:DNA-binding transcriptional LysR family regulator